MTPPTKMKPCSRGILSLILTGRLTPPTAWPFSGKGWLSEDAVLEVVCIVWKACWTSVWGSGSLSGWDDVNLGRVDSTTVVDQHLDERGLLTKVIT